PAPAKSLPDCERTHEAEPLRTEFLHRLVIGAADRRHQPFSGPRRAGVHPGIEGSEVDTGSETIATDRFPVSGAVDGLDVLCRNVAQLGLCRARPEAAIGGE